MRVENNITIYTGAQQTNAAGGQGNDNENRKTVFAGNLQQGLTIQDRIEQRKEEAQKKALKVVGDVFDADRSLDADLEERRNHVSELKDEKKALMDEKAVMTSQKEDLEKAFENGELSEDEYNEQSKYMNDLEKEWNHRYAENESTAMQENAIIRGTKQERLKKAPMVNAQKEAEEIMDEARKDIIGMIQDEAKKHIDEENAEREEKAEEIKEEKEEQEELIEKRKERKEELEEIIEDLPVTEMLTLEKLQSDVEQEVQKILNDMKLVAEDIKGAAVDKSV